MQNSKKNDKKKVIIVKEVNVPATIRLIPHGTTVRFARRDLGSEITVRAAVWRENTKTKDPEYFVELIDKGAFYDITRK